MHLGSTSRVGGFGALSVAIFTGLFFVFLVLGARLSADPDQVLWPHVLADYALALVGLGGLAAVPAVTARVAAVDRELSKWASTVAQLGFGLMTVMSLWQAEYETSLAASALDLPSLTYDVQPDASTSFLQSVLTRLPQGWLEVGGVAFWIGCVSLLARRRRQYPEALVGLGVAAAACGLVTPLAASVQVMWLAALGQVLFFALLGPAWFLWMGSLLLDGVPAACPPETLPAASATVEAPPVPRRRRYAIVPTLRRWADRMPSLN